MNNFFGIFAMPLSYILSFLYNFIGQYGISLIVLTIIVKLALYPLYKKQIISTTGMSGLSSKVRELQVKYANDRKMMNEKMQELYKEEGVNPASGCLPMFVQMLVIMGLFILLRYPTQYLGSEYMFFAVHERFFWVNDLSQPDPWILPLLAGVATFLSMYMSQQNNTVASSGAMMGVMKYGMPVMIIWLAKTYPAGLALYWFISNLMQIFFNIRFNKIREEMNGEKTGKKKKRKKRA